MQPTVANQDVAETTTGKPIASLPTHFKLPRWQFLNSNGFRRDPFANQTAEQEYAHADRIELEELPGISATSTAGVNGQVHDLSAELSTAPTADKPAIALTPSPALPSSQPQQSLAESKPLFSPLAFFVDPVYARRLDGFILEELRRRQHSFVFGRPGAGKTTTRFALEAHIRTEPRRTLNVTVDYTGQAAVDAADLNRRLIRAIATDLFVQVVEQFAHRQAEPTAAQDEAMLWLLARGGRELRRVLERLLSEREPSPTWGLAALWRLLNRPIVRPAMPTELLKTWLTSLQERLTSSEAVANPAGSWQDAVKATHAWEIETIFLAIDGIDTEQRTRRDMMKILRPLLDKAPAFAAQGIYLKGFLPLELRDDVQQRLLRAGVADEDARFIELHWERQRLQALLMERYIAAGAARRSLTDLVTPELGDIDERVLVEANGSPRRLVTLIDQLITVHTARPPVMRPITDAEWKEAIRLTDDILRGQY